MNAQLTEIMRLITNLIRTGVVTEVDRTNWLCRVKTGDLETNWINWLTLRAGNARTWWKPSEGEQVVLLSLGGNLETAFALPAVYSNQFAPPSTSADACVTEHPDGGWFEYEPATGRWYVRGIKSMVIEAADNITMKTSEFVLEADRTRINSEVVINGGVVIGLNGYVTIPLIISGSRRTLIIQWGQARFGGSGGEDAGYLNDFPFAFPSACYGMIVSHVGHTPSGAGILSASAITSNQFRGFSSIATAANAVLGRYIAIGV